MSVPRVHAIRTGLVQVRQPQMESHGNALGRMAAMLFDPQWTEWLPIYAWVIEHDEGVIVVDTGETAQVHVRGYHPRWHPFYQRAARFSVHPDEEIGPQLRMLGITARDVRHVVLTHLHTDHAGGLGHLTGSRFWVARPEFERAQGWSGRLQGYLPHRFPKWWAPEWIRFSDRPLGPFQRSMALTSNEDILIVSTPGHTPDHVSVVVRGSPSFFLAGDTSYNQRLLLEGKSDGVSPKPAVTLDTLRRIRMLAVQERIVYLPSHDPESAQRLANRAALTIDETQVCWPAD